MTAAKHRPINDFWEAPHRPLFSAAILCALMTVAWWPLGVWFGLPSPAFEPVVLWHVHELVFGFAGAAVGGYILTALPSWTGNPPVRGNALKLLLASWLSARFGMAFVPEAPLALLVVLNSTYFLLMAGIVSDQLLRTRALNKLVFVLAVIALGIAEALFLVSAMARAPWTGLAMGQASVVGLIMLIVGVGMRAIPAFTNNWLVQNSHQTRLCQSSTRALVLTQILLATSLVARLMSQNNVATAVMICAALILLWEVRKWQTPAVLPNPLLAALHISFLWVPIGLVAVAISDLVPGLYPTADALHAITIGGMSGLIMAISGRAAAHTGRGEMKANSGLVIAFLLVWMATCTRLAAPIFFGASLVILAASIWCAAWVAFAVGFLPALTNPLRRPVLSGRRNEALAKISGGERTG